MTHADIAEMLGAYALDAVDPDEASAIERHLAECPRCRAEVAAFHDVAGALGNLGGAAPPGLWEKVAAELVLGAEAEPYRPATVPYLAAPAEIARTTSTSTALPQSGTSARSATLWGLGTARRRSVVLGSVAALAAALAIVVGVLSSKVVNLDNQVSALSAGVVAGGVKAQVAAAELDPHHVTLSLVSANRAWSASVVAVPDGQAFIVPGKMPAIPAGKTFQAWAVVDGRYISLGVLGRSPGDVALQLEPGMSSVLVNTEPQGGAPQPTTAALISASVPSSL